jgi:tetratricopeptide (TPR) repeat protein
VNEQNTTTKCMDNIVPLLYLSILLVSLITLSVFIGGQIIERKKIEDNLSVLQNKIRNNEANAEDYYELGSIYLSKKLFDQAILQFRYALQIWKNEDLEGISSLYNTIGFTYAETEQYELAIYYYKEALKNDNQYTVALNNLGYAYEKERMISEALAAYRQVIEKEPDNETAASRIQVLKRRIPKSG